MADVDLESRLEAIADAIVARVFDKLVAKLSTGELEVPLPPSDGAPARRPRAPARVKPEAKRLPAAMVAAGKPMTPTSPPPGTKNAQLIDAVVKLMTHHDPANNGIQAGKLREFMADKQHLTPQQCRKRLIIARKAGAIQSRGTTRAAMWFRT